MMAEVRDRPGRRKALVATSIDGPSESSEAGPGAIRAMALEGRPVGPKFWPAEAVKETSIPTDSAQGATVLAAHLMPSGRIPRPCLC
ncbi:hypothetical protein BTHI11S_03389 [Bosea thiooxidans]